MSGRILQILAALAKKSVLQTLHTLCETQRQVSTHKLERYLDDVGDVLAGYAYTLRVEYDALQKSHNAALAELAALKGGREAVAWVTTARKPGVSEQRALWHGEDGADQWVSHYLGRGCETTKTPLFTSPPAQASAWVAEGWKLVPVEPTEEMWGGLARDLMLWLDFPTPSVEALRKHLRMLGTEWPAWMDDESEMQGAGVPSKGTRATLIYKAMLAAAPTPGASDGKGGE